MAFLALDGLMLVDLRNTPLAMISRYMSREEATRFLDRHQALSA
jgi:hypothetical protein